MRPKILHFAPDTESHTEIQSILKDNFSVKSFSKIENLLKTIKSGKYVDLILLDNTRYDSDVLKNVEVELDRSQVSLCVISDSRCEKERIKFFEQGVDDYINKPVSVDELIVRLRNKSKRKRVLKDSSVKLGNIVLNFETQTAFLDGNEVNLTPIEFKILSILIRKPSKIHGKIEIATFLWGTSAKEKYHSLDTHICNLRKKIKGFSYKIKSLKRRGMTLAIA